jgi:hypothetical protein
VPAAAPITIEPVESRAQLRRFADVPFVLLGHDGRWAPGVRAHEQWRLDARRHPYFERGDAAFLLARRGGRPVGRIAAHVDGSGSGAGWFGCWDVADDASAASALVEAARTWLAERGATSMVGPVTWTVEEDAGVLVEGHEHPAATGRPWHPLWYARLLRDVPAGSRTDGSPPTASRRIRPTATPRKPAGRTRQRSLVATPTRRWSSTASPPCPT